MTVRHQLVVARLTTAGALDTTYGAAPPVTRSPTSTAPRPPSMTSTARRLRVDATGTALVVATVKSTSGPATHLIGLARLTPAGALDAAFGTAGTRTQDVSPSHITDAAALVTLPGGGFVVGGAMGVGSTSQFGLAGYHEDGSPDTTLNPANVDRRQRGEPAGRHGRHRPHLRARRHPAGPPARRGRQPDAERAERSARSSASAATPTPRRPRSR